MGLKLKLTLVASLTGVAAILILFKSNANLVGNEASALQPTTESATIATLGHPAKSPSGEFSLHVLNPDPAKRTLLSFEIKDQNALVVYRSEQLFDNRSTTYWLWDKENRVWVYSGDVGTYFWAQQTDGSWRRFTYGKEDVPAPAYLKAKRPKWHKK